MSFIAGMWCGMALMGAAVLGLAVWLSKQLPRATYQAGRSEAVGKDGGAVNTLKIIWIVLEFAADMCVMGALAVLSVLCLTDHHQPSQATVNAFALLALLFLFSPERKEGSK